MSDTRHPEFSDRLLELCLDRALDEPTNEEARELRELDTQGEAYTLIETTLAEIDLAAAENDPIEIPVELMDSIAAQYADPSPGLKLAGDSAMRPVGQSRPVQWFPWTVAAAAVLMALTALVLSKSSPPLPSLAEQRAAFIDQTPADQRLQWDWIVTEDSANAGGVTGDIVWSDEANRGYMKIVGLEMNNPNESQYQLWIFDATRPEGELPQFGEGLLSQRPIDGGVFDITESGELIIEIDAKLAVKQAAAFAVTIEPPGGVVVSDRSRVPLLALAP